LPKYESCGPAIPAESPEVDLVPTSVVPVAAKIYSKSQQQQQHQQQQPPAPLLYGPQQQPAPTAMPASGGMTCNSKCGRAANLPYLTCCRFCLHDNSDSDSESF
jgi:hypothetical protein